jgi:hypothetical protein
MKMDYQAGDLRLQLGSDYTAYVNEVIFLDPLIVTNSIIATKKIRACCVSSGQPRPNDEEFDACFRAHWREWVRLSMKTVRAKRNPAIPAVASQHPDPHASVLQLPTLPQATQQSVFPSTPASTNGGAPSETAKLMMEGLMARGELGSYSGMLAFLRVLFRQTDATVDEVQQPFPCES